jgi:glycosyltransferase involved in cell wall biosynthesis
MHVLLDALGTEEGMVESLESVDALCRSEVDIVLLHWTETVMWQSRSRKELLSNAIKLLRFMSRPAHTRPKIIWVAHNLKPHRLGGVTGRIWPGFVRAFVRRVDGVITLSPGTVAPVRRAFPALRDTPCKGVWHPAYPTQRLSKAVARQRFGLPEGAHVFGCCGQLRKHKNFEHAAAVFSITTDPNLRLLIAGKPTDRDVAARLKAVAQEDPRIIIAAEDLSAQDFEMALASCDTAVLPFSDYLHSGSMVHALSAGCHVVTPQAPFARPLRDAMGKAWMTLYEGELTVDTLEGAASSCRAVTAPDNLSALSPKRCASDIIAFAHHILSEAGTAQAMGAPIRHVKRPAFAALHAVHQRHSSDLRGS